MSAGLRAAIIAVREFPPMNGRDGKTIGEPKKSHIGLDEIVRDSNPRAGEVEAEGQRSGVGLKLINYV